jgi:alpha-beta hydrolase superfamily lysophospholipase
MQTDMRCWVLALLLSLVAAGCDSGDEASSSPKLAPPTPAPTAPPAPPPTGKKTTSFESADGASLAGDLYLAKPTAPAVVLVHRLHAERAELAPLAERLARAEKRFTILNFDLRGHGDSQPPKKDKKKPERFDADVVAAIDHVVQASGDKVPRVLLVGSSFGAALVSRVASSQPKVTALALLSPGAAIDGLDIYEPYAVVRQLPTFIAASVLDNVSKAPFQSLSKMAKAGQTKQYPGSRHSAGHVADEHPALWSDLIAWLESQYDEKPADRPDIPKPEDDKR